MAEAIDSMGVQNPESLHLLAKSQKPMTKSNFVNPGTPASALVTYDQLSSAVIKGSGSDSLRSDQNLIKF